MRRWPGVGCCSSSGQKWGNRVTAYLQGGVSNMMLLRLAPIMPISVEAALAERIEVVGVWPATLFYTGNGAIVGL